MQGHGSSFAISFDAGRGTESKMSSHYFTVLSDVSRYYTVDHPCGESHLSTGMVTVFHHFCCDKLLGVLLPAFPDFTESALRLEESLYRDTFILQSSSGTEDMR